MLLSYPIRNGHVSIVKHRSGNYATHAFRIYVALLTVGRARPAPAAMPGRRTSGTRPPTRPPVRASISFGVRTTAGCAGSGVAAERAVGQRRQGDAARGLPAAAGRARRRRLTAGERALLGPMIRRSDNAAASRVCNIVGTGGLARLAGRVRMRRFHATRPWGLSTIDVADQTRFLLHIDRYVPRRHRRYALRLLGSIVPSQRWGIARVRPRGWALYFKGGWGSGHRLGRPPGGAAPPRPAAHGGGDPDHLEPEPRVRQGDAARHRGPPAARAAPELAAALIGDRRQTDARDVGFTPCRARRPATGELCS